MKKFSQLYKKLHNQSDLDIQSEFVDHFLIKADELTKEWAIFLLRGGGIKRLISSADLVRLALTQISFSPAIYERCLDFTTDAIEAISLMLPISTQISDENLGYWMEQINSINRKNKIIIPEFILATWQKLRADERYIFNKIITNTWRAPIDSASLVVALSKYFNLSIFQQAYNLYRTPLLSKSTLDALTVNCKDDHVVFPKEFISPTILEELTTLDHAEDYHCAQEWNGVRVQWVIADGKTALWTRRNELITDKFPELNSFVESIPSHTILDGILLATSTESILPKSIVRKRLNRKNITAKIIKTNPISFCAIDLMKLAGVDHSTKTHDIRKQLLDDLIKSLPLNQIIQTSEEIKISDWEDLPKKWNEIKSLNSTAVIIKHRCSLYKNNVVWHKLKAPPHRAKGILLYVKRGEGALARHFIEFTLGCKAGGKLIPFTKVKPKFYDDELLAINKFIKENTIERFGPVLSLKAKLVFDISFESVQESKRHKCGFVLKNPLFISWLKNEDEQEISLHENFIDQIR